MKALSPKIRQLIGLTLVASIFLYLALQLSGDWQQVQSIPWEKSWHLLLPALSLCLVVQCMLCSIWHFLVQLHKPCQYKKKALLRSYFLPVLGKYLPGKVLFVLGRIEFLKRLGLTRSDASLLFLLETFLLIITATVLSLPFASLILGELGIVHDYFSNTSPSILTVILIAIAITGYTLTLATLKKLSIHSETLSHFLQSIFLIHKNIREKPGHFFMFFNGYIVLWFCYGVAGILTSFSISPDIFPTEESWHQNIITASLIGSAFIASWLIGFLAIFSPGGLGVREISLILFLSPVMSSVDASLAALIARLLWTISEFGFVALALLHKEPETSP